VLVNVEAYQDHRTYHQNSISRLLKIDLDQSPPTLSDSYLLQIVKTISIKKTRQLTTRHLDNNNRAQELTDLFADFEAHEMRNAK
jgi:hypothetical protein